MRNKLLYTLWSDKRRSKAKNIGDKCQIFLSQYNPTDNNQVLSDLCTGLNMYNGSPSSCYLTFIPRSGLEVVKLRISDHPSSETEWGMHEITGYPNRRYSIVIFSNKTMPKESEQGQMEVEWKSYTANNIPVYEKGYNQAYLNSTFDSLKGVITAIFYGNHPEDNTLRVNLNEESSEVHSIVFAKNKKDVVRLTEVELCEIIEKAILEFINL